MSGTKLLVKNYEKVISDTSEKNKNYYTSNISQQIINRMIHSRNTQVSEIGQQLKIKYNREPKKVNRILYHLVSNLDQIKDKHTKLDITEEEYKKLIKKKKKGTINKDNDKILEKALFTKVCHCVKKKLSIQTAKWLLGEFDNISIEKLPYNAYAVCTYSIYNQRGFKRSKSFQDCN